MTKIIGNCQEYLREYSSIGLEKKPESALTIGNFDGVHIAHQEIIEDVVNCAKKNNIISIVVTFRTNTKLLDENELITQADKKLSLIEKQKPNYIINQSFDDEFKSITRKEFVENILIKIFNVKFLFVGSNFRFGSKKLGDISFLKRYNRCFVTTVAKTKIVENNVISSSLIRKLLKNGNCKEAEKLLGRVWSFSSYVIEGSGKGSKQLVPTANLFIKNSIIKKGVYAACATICDQGQERALKGVVNFGYSPTFGEKKLKLEIHLFNFRKNIYNKRITVYFVELIREERKFDSFVDLREQIEKDCKHAMLKLENINIFELG